MSGDKLYLVARVLIPLPPVRTRGWGGCYGRGGCRCGSVASPGYFAHKRPKLGAREVLPQANGTRHTEPHARAALVA